MPVNAAKPWIEHEDRELLDKFRRRAGQVAQLAQAHARTPAGIQAHLERHGRVPVQGLKWQRRAATVLADATRGENSET